MGHLFIRISAAALLLIAPMESVIAQQACGDLSNLSLPYTTITSAKLVPEGPVPVPAIFGNAPPVVAPEHCEVQAITRPTSDSEIRLELWLPVSSWNGKYLQIGNGGWAGSINRLALIDPLRRGYAVAGTDDGHSAQDPGASWAIGHPEKLIDFGYRAVHETSVQAKAILNTYFGRPQELSYFNGCSDGGREALMEAQRYPEDFNGIIAGAPANSWSHLFTGFVWNEIALAENPLPLEKLPVIQNAVLAACDDLDGVEDGLIENPGVCQFDPAVLACEIGDKSDCLAPGQVSTLEKIYTGAINPRTGESIFPGWPMGTEAVPGGWVPWILSPAPQAMSIQGNFGNTYYGHAVFEQLEWDYSSLDFDNDVTFGDDKAGLILNSTNPDLRSFRANGGKLIQYHGWGDAAISAFNSIDYYENVNRFLNRFPDPRSDTSNVEDFYRLFLVPGMGHCSGGIGPNSFGNGFLATVTDAEHDLLGALEAWVELDTAPAKIIGTGTVVDDPTISLTRPLCPYPQTAQYIGSGDQNNAENFVCALPADTR
ncbi:MAG: tannase/feruloyl esterase family alpha/beta hydrolase [Gammaproteobacteria bacterium]|nr:tannase/feruloyl esterase family alpha/beta hydrolase [Gammaproteobacteria bacterium]